MRYAQMFYGFIFVASMAIGQSAAAPSGAYDESPKAFIEGFYNLVLARHISGIPAGNNARYFAPYLSENLRRKIRMTVACSNDWRRKNKGRLIKAPSGWWSEAGIFTGEDERSAPDDFDIENIESRKNNEMYVHVLFTIHPEGKVNWSLKEDWRWRVIVILRRNRNRLYVDDVIFLKEYEFGVEWRLTERLTRNCSGSHFVETPRDAKRQGSMSKAK